MKKIFLIATLAIFTLTASAQRWQNAPADNTGRNLTFLSITKSLSSTDSIKPCGSESFYKFNAITAAKTLIIKTTEAKLWDRVTVEFTCDTLTPGRVVTFSTGTGANINTLWTSSSGNTITVKTSKKAVVTFLYDGTAWSEEKRSVQQ